VLALLRLVTAMLKISFGWIIFLVERLFDLRIASF